MNQVTLWAFSNQKDAPRVIITNGLLVGEYDNIDDWEIAEEMGVTNYGQMTAGGWMYIGPQGIVHGTFNTLLNAGRLKLGIKDDGDLAGKLFVSSGLGGMSGAQGKAGEIANAVAIIAEVDKSRIDTRLEQGWISNLAETPEEAINIATSYLNKMKRLQLPITAILSIYWNTLTKMMYQLIYYLIKPLVIMCTMEDTALLALRLKKEQNY